MNLGSDVAWLSLMVRGRMGALTFAITEDGNIGIFGYDGPAMGSGDTAEEALSEAHRRWHEADRPEDKTDCVCVMLDREGLDIHQYLSERLAESKESVESSHLPESGTPVAQTGSAVDSAKSPTDSSASPPELHVVGEVSRG